MTASHEEKHRSEPKSPQRSVDNLPEEAPPFFKTWTALYTLVIAELGLTILAFYFFTKLFE